MCGWVYNPHVGGVKIPPAVQEHTKQRINAYAEKHYTGKVAVYSTLPLPCGWGR